MEDGNATSSTLNQTSILPAGRDVFLSFLFAINIFLSFTASLSNALILIALRKVSSLHPPSKLLFGCLAVTDLGVGLITQPLFAIFILNFATEENWNINYVFLLKVCRASSIILCAVSLFTSTAISAKVFPASSFLFCGVSIFTSSAISVDRLLALLLGLRYRHFVTLRRVSAVISCCWLIAVSVMFTNLFLSFSVALTVAVSLAVLSVVISVFFLHEDLPYTSTTASTSTSPR